MDTQPAGLRIRDGRPEDYPAVLDIQRRAYRLKEVPLYGDDLPPLQETPATLAAELAGGKRLLVGEWDGRVVASLRMTEREDGSVYFCRLSVDPEYQGRGIGQRLALAVEEWHPQATAFVLDCGEKSAENMYIYTKLGYETTGESFQVPDGPKVLVMKKRARGRPTADNRSSRG